MTLPPPPPTPPLTMGRSAGPWSSTGRGRTQGRRPGARARRARGASGPRSSPRPKVREAPTPSCFLSATFMALKKKKKKTGATRGFYTCVNSIISFSDREGVDGLRHTVHPHPAGVAVLGPVSCYPNECFADVVLSGFAFRLRLVVDKEVRSSCTKRTLFTTHAHAPSAAARRQHGGAAEVS